MPDHEPAHRDGDEGDEGDEPDYRAVVADFDPDADGDLPN
jgi:hypothetical protein